MAKRIAFSVLCTLLVLVVILTGIVIRRVSRIMLWSTPQDPISTDAPAIPTVPSTPAVPTNPTEPTEPPHEHSLVLTNSIKPTCEGYGWNIYTCSECGFVEMPADERQEPLGHNYKAGEITPPTCTAAGHTTYTCQRCFRIITDDVTDPLGHSFTAQTEVPPTCTEDGYTIIRCSNADCNEISETVIHEVAATGHTYGAWTYGLGGLPQPLCSVCFADWSGTSGGPLPDVYSIVSHSHDDLRHPDYGPFGFYEIHIGIANDPLAPTYLYTISDYLDNGSLIFYYDPQQGLVIRYNDQNDLPTQIVLDPESEESATIRPAETVEEPTEEPTEPVEDPTEEPTEPVEDPT